MNEVEKMKPRQISERQRELEKRLFHHRAVANDILSEVLVELEKVTKECSWYRTALKRVQFELSGLGEKDWPLSAKDEVSRVILLSGILRAHIEDGIDPETVKP
jgi:hypothetical protein